MFFKKNNTETKNGYKVPEVLDDLVERFIKYYKDSLLDILGFDDHFDGFRLENELRNVIEKMAVWYELRYPDCEINKIIPFEGQRNVDIDNIMFNSNGYVNEQLNGENDFRLLDWDKFYNFKAFLESLSSKERYFIGKYKYPEIVYLDFNGRHIHLDSDGFVEEDEILFGELEHQHITDVVGILKEKGVIIPEDSEILKAIREHINKDKLTNGVLEAVMYRIIERGNNRIGARRAYLFAKEFNVSKDIPLIYGIDLSDPGLRVFINQFLKDGGSHNLSCYVGYCSRYEKYEALPILPISSILKIACYNENEFYTPLETELHQSLVNILSRRLEKKD